MRPHGLIVLALAIVLSACETRPVVVPSSSASSQSPAPSIASSSTPTTPPPSTVPPTPQLPLTAEAAADNLALALQFSDFARLEALIGDGRWTVAFQQGEALPSMTAAEAVRWLRDKAGPQLAASVQTRPLFPTNPFLPAGQYYIDSRWMHVAAREMKGSLVLRQGTHGWEWSGVVFSPP